MRAFKFYASLGNHDSPNNRTYPLFNMGGERYYSIVAKNVRFIALDSDQIDAEATGLADGSPEELEGRLERSAISIIRCIPTAERTAPPWTFAWCSKPLFVTYGVNVVFRARPHLRADRAAKRNHLLRGGAGGQLRKGDSKSIGHVGQDLRPGSELHAGRNRRRRALISNRLPHRPDSRFGTIRRRP